MASIYIYIYIYSGPKRVPYSCCWAQIYTTELHGPLGFSEGFMRNNLGHLLFFSYYSYST